MLELEDLKTVIGDGFYYLASPYSKWEDGLDDADWQISKIAGRIMKRGVCVFSPIVHAHKIARAANIDPFSHDFWLPMDAPIARCAGGMIIAGLPGWRTSYGIGKELEWFGAMKKPRYLLDPQTLAVQVFT